jgi:hypothetical protein
MKNYAIALLTGSMLAGAALAHDGEMKGAKEPVQTMQGEVVDLACYAAHEGKGDKHAQCAKECLKGGAPAGLLTKDGKVFVLVNSHEAEKAYQSLKDLGGEQAKITGQVSKRGGLQAFIVEKVEKAQ